MRLSTVSCDAGRRLPPAGMQSAGPPLPSISHAKSMMPAPSDACEQDDGAGAVTEQDARGSVRVVDDARHDVRADDQRVLVHTVGDELRRRGEGIGEARARGPQVEAPRPRRADRGAAARRRCSERSCPGVVVPTTMSSMSAGVSPALRDRLASGFGREVGRRDALVDDVPLADARSAGGSTRRSSRPSSPDRRSTGPAAARTSPATRCAPACTTRVDGAARLLQFLRDGHHRRWSFPGATSPKYAYARAVATRPRGVRSRKPICIRNGS